VGGPNTLFQKIKTKMDMLEIPFLILQRKLYVGELSYYIAFLFLR
jgi:hypothetical protein